MPMKKQVMNFHSWSAPFRISGVPPPQRNNAGYLSDILEKPPTLNYNQCQQLGTTSQYYHQYQFLQLVSAIQVPMALKHKPILLLISVPIRQWLGILSVNISSNGSPHATPLYSYLEAACKKLMQTRLGYCVRVHIGQ